MGGAVTKAAGTAVSAAASTTVKTLHAIDAQVVTSEEAKFQKKVATTAWPPWRTRVVAPRVPSLCHRIPAPLPLHA